MGESVCVFSSLPETLCCAAAATAVAGCLGSLVAAALVTSRRHCQLRVMGPTERKQTTETLHPVAPPLTSPLEDCRPIKDKLTDAHVRNTIHAPPILERFFFFFPSPTWSSVLKSRMSRQASCSLQRCTSVFGWTTRGSVSSSSSSGLKASAHTVYRRGGEAYRLYTALRFRFTAASLLHNCFSKRTTRAHTHKDGKTQQKEFQDTGPPGYNNLCMCIQYNKLHAKQTE